MQVELNQNEVSLIKEALVAWENEAGSSALTGSLLSVMLCPKGEREEWANKEKLEMVKAQATCKQRKDQATLIRAKLIQASARASEHEEVQHASH